MTVAVINPLPPNESSRISTSGAGTDGESTRDVLRGTVATVDLGEGGQPLEANSLGNFPVQPVVAEQEVGIELSLPAVEPGTPVAVEAQDGGMVDGKMAMIERVSANRTLPIPFIIRSPSSERGRERGRSFRKGVGPSY